MKKWIDRVSWVALLACTHTFAWLDGSSSARREGEPYLRAVEDSMIASTTLADRLAKKCALTAPESLDPSKDGLAYDPRTSTMVLATKDLCGTAMPCTDLATGWWKNSKLPRYVFVDGVLERWTGTSN